jgi:hypothetical protein
VYHDASVAYNDRPRLRPEKASPEQQKKRDTPLETVSTVLGAGSFNGIVVLERVRSNGEDEDKTDQ